MMLDAEAPSEFDVRIANAEFFRELSVFGQMFSMRWVLWVKRERRIARPFAALIEPVTWDAAGTAQICHDDSARFDNKQEKPQPEPPSHSPTCPVTDPHADRSIGSLEPNRSKIVPSETPGGQVGRLPPHLPPKGACQLTGLAQSM